MGVAVSVEEKSIMVHGSTWNALGWGVYTLVHLTKKTSTKCLQVIKFALY